MPGSLPSPIPSIFHSSSVYIFSNYWLSEVYVFNRSAIGYWLLAFGFLANSQQPTANSLFSPKVPAIIIIPLCVKSCHGCFIFHFPICGQLISYTSASKPAGMDYRYGKQAGIAYNEGTAVSFRVLYFAEYPTGFWQGADGTGADGISSREVVIFYP